MTLYNIEDDLAIDEFGLDLAGRHAAEWIADLEALLAKHGAFYDYLVAEGRE